MLARWGKWVCVWVSGRQTLCEHAFKSFTSHNQSIYRSIYMHSMYVFYYVCMVIYLKIPQCVRIHNFLKFIGWLSIIHSGNTHTHPMRNWAYYGSLVECTKKLSQPFRSKTRLYKQSQLLLRLLQIQFHDL